jgi:hypothetical protein
LGAKKSWFTERWDTTQPGTWAIIEGQKAGTFRLLTRRRPRDAQQDRCRIIWVDTIHEAKRFGFRDNDDDEMVYFENLSRLLEFLELDNQAGMLLNPLDIVKQSQSIRETLFDDLNPWERDDHPSFLGDSCFPDHSIFGIFDS